MFSAHKHAQGLRNVGINGCSEGSLEARFLLSHKFPNLGANFVTLRNFNADLYVNVCLFMGLM